MLVMNPVALGSLVQQVRRRRRMSQTRLCEAAGVSRGWLSAFEAGKSTSEIGLAFRVINALGLALDVSTAPTPEFDLDEVIRAYRQGADADRG